MTEQPRTFTAPVAGRYHFLSGQEPHLVADCTEACRQPFDGRFVAEPGMYQTFELSLGAGSSVAFENSGGFVEAPTTTTAIPFVSS